MFYPGLPYLPGMQARVSSTSPQQFYYPPPELWYEYWKNTNAITQKPQMVDVAIGTDSAPQGQDKISHVKIQAGEPKIFAEPEIKQQQHRASKKRRRQSQKKNTETNIINQLFSFLISHDKSRTKLSTLTNGCHIKQEIFYTVIKCLHNAKSKYLNRKYLMNLIFLSQGSEQIKVVQRNKHLTQDLSISEFKSILIKLSIYFLKTKSECCLLQSKRIRDTTLLTHLQKRRQLIKMILVEAQRMSKQKFKQQQKQQ